MATLILNHLSKAYDGGRAAVNGVSLTVRDGGFLALLGPSGCGKTTLLRMIAGFEQPSDGSIVLGERVISTAEGVLPPERRNMAMVFQSYALWPHMTVAQNVGYPLKLRGVKGENLRRKTMEALDVVRLADLADRRPAALSGGQRQRVALARCLVTSPDVVLLDEPLANLDRHLRAAMEETFRDFHARSGATMIYVTHDQAEAMALATEIAVMSEGRFLQVAPPNEIYAHPEGRVVGGLIGQGTILSLPVGEGRERSLDRAACHALLLGEAGGSLCDVLIRPEHVRPAVDGIALQVRECVFTGERHALTLARADGSLLKAFSAERLAPGSMAVFSVERGWRL
ncbi:ABC-type Fe3+/spermidine/putrescine transport system ATPase subunit [Rhizobium azooxidifex]|uniref:ABC-type Fe3+/spermidine/putrescine transport system ATPase subunit n=1 Tax=Mycoplana azooxidifex TaxID=1636188 RepID=A0A7W6D6Z0_9HYPH|nr:ABC-type Fe3+/spermidine/putrescine transport system ATPase subunit [Mycoplana azooxidifex]